MADSELTEAEKIRAKRLANLERLRQGSGAPEGGEVGDRVESHGKGKGSPGQREARAPSDSTVAKSASPVSAGTSSSTLAQKPYELPQRHLKQKARLPPALEAKYNNAQTLRATQGHQGVSSASSSSSISAEHFDVPYDKWAGRAVARILAVTLDRDEATKGLGAVTHLSDLSDELQAEGASTSCLPFEDPDRIILARMSMDPSALSGTSGTTTFQYLCGVWSRCTTEKRGLQSRFDAQASLQSELGKRLDLIDQLRQLAVSYAGLVIQDPSMFPQASGAQLGHAELVSLLIASVAAEPSPPFAQSPLIQSRSVMSFINELVNRFIDDGLTEIFEPVLEQICINPMLKAMELIQPSAEDGFGWREHDILLENLLSNKALVNVLVRDRSFNATTLGGTTIGPEGIEKCTLLGPITRLNLFADTCPSILTLYFKNAKDQTKEEIQSALSILRASLSLHQRSLFSIFDHLIRAGPDAKEAVLKYWSRIANENLKRGAMQVDPATVSTDGFMLNITAVLLEFAKPFSGAKDPQYSKLGKIDVDYLKQSTRVIIKDETRLRATAEEAAAWHASSQPGTPNFISDIFYLTLAHLHFGLHRAIVNFNEDIRVADQIEEQISEAGDGDHLRGTPMAAQFEASIARAKMVLNHKSGRARSAEVQLLNPSFTDDVLAFYNLVMTWLVRLVDPTLRHPTHRISLPLSEEIPDNFKFLPEYIVEDVTEFLSFISRHQPHALARCSTDELITFCMTFLSSPWYIKNPYLKAKLIDVLFYNTLGYPGKPRGALGDVINTHPLALRHVMPALMGFYIEVESTGLSSQFYDKFNIRYHIAHIWRCVWTTPEHRAQLAAETSMNHEKFVRFINLLMNDCTYLLDEGLSKLALIHDVQVLKADETGWSRMTEEERKDKDRSLHEAERMARSYVALGNETLSMLERFTSEAADPFVSGEIVDRLAAMLNFNLSIMAGPRMQQLRVERPEEYHFRPRQILSDLIQVYLNLAHKKEFVAAIANDGRSYRPELFAKVGQIAVNRALKTSDEVQRLQIMVQQVEELKAMEREDEEMGEIPDHYLDPLMATLMRDPVTLPSSKIVVDRSTIKSHLLSDANDPFNRQPLKIEQVIDNTALKEEIAAWKRDRRMTSKALQMDMS